MIEFVLEDGTGLSNATSYVSVDEFFQYWENRGVDCAQYQNNDVQCWLNNASSHADNTHTWDGLLLTETQSLSAPRSLWCDVYGRNISESVPTFLKNGVCELANIIKIPSSNSIKTGISSKRLGPMSISYSNPESVNSQKTIYPDAENWFKKLGQRYGIDIFPT